MSPNAPTWPEECQHYERLAQGACDRLPRARLARSGTPAWIMGIVFDAADAAATAKAIDELITTVTARRPRRYFQLTPNLVAKHFVLAESPGRRLALLHLFDPLTRRMVTRLDVGGA